MVTPAANDAAAPPSGTGGAGGAGVPGIDQPPLPPADPAPGAGLLSLGASCAGAGETCASGHCVDGVCCAEACASPCLSCGLPELLGQCSPIPSGQDPDNDCELQPAAMCGLDGTCDGAGACRRHPSGTECAPGGCLGAVEQAARVCDGAGVCLTAQSKSCAPSVCRMGSCSTRCVAAADCQAGFFCDVGTCKLRRPLGQACTAGGQCASGACVDGVCCNGACTERCAACNLTGTVGRCTPVAAGQDPAAECTAQNATTCGRDGSCDGAGACRLHATGTVCGAPACSGQIATSRRVCNGRGMCAQPTRSDCGGFACTGDACGAFCVDDEGCAPGFSCNGTTCVEQGLVLYWKLDEPAGATAIDSSGNGFAGTYLAGASRPTPARPVEPPLRFPNPRSRAFDGEQQQGIVLTTMPTPLRPTEELTLSVWYRATTVDTGGGSELITAGNNTLLRLREGEIEVAKRVPDGLDAAYARCLGAAPGHLDGNWHHVATVIDATSVTIYFDGAQICQLMNVQPLLYDRGPDLFVGRHGEGQTDFDFDGNMDEVRIYSKALTPERIRALAQGGN